VLAKQLMIDQKQKAWEKCHTYLYYHYQAYFL
jgi:hypothetical protein